MSERLYVYSEFAKSRRPDVRVYGAIVRSNTELREDSVRLQDYWQDHLTRSKSSIEKAAARAGFNRAIIYGAGNCTDIPLGYLADSFDRLTVVDIEPQGVTAAVEVLPGNLQAKVDIQVEDLTNVIAEAAETFTLLLSQSNSPTDFAEKVLANLPKIQPQTPDFGDNYDFVCSNLLGSQLPAFVGIAFAIIGNSKYPYARFNENSISMRAQRTDQPGLVNNFVYLLQQAHIDLLLKSAKRPGGIIYLADTFDQAYLKRNPFTMEPYFIDEQGRPTAQPNKIPILAFNKDTVKKLEAGTNIVDHAGWMWYRRPPIGTGTGQAFGVRSFTLMVINSIDT